MTYDNALMNQRTCIPYFQFLELFTHNHDVNDIFIPTVQFVILSNILRHSSAFKITIYARV